MFKIGDFSKLNKIPVKTLRYYDELGLLKPAKVDTQTGYRFYSALQLARLNKILALKDLGFSLNQIGELIDSKSTKEMLSTMLKSRKEEIEQSIIAEKEKLSRIERIISNINEEDSIMLKYDMVIKEAEAIQVASIRDIIPSYSQQHGLWQELGDYIRGNNAKITPPCLVIYYDQGFKDSDIDIEVAEHFTGNLSGNDRIKIKNLDPVKQMACTIHQGSYEKLSLAYSALMKWIEDNGYEILGPNRELYLEGEWSQKSPEQYITEIQIPVTK